MFCSSVREWVASVEEAVERVFVKVGVSSYLHDDVGQQDEQTLYHLVQLADVVHIVLAQHLVGQPAAQQHAAHDHVPEKQQEKLHTPASRPHRQPLQVMDGDMEMLHPVRLFVNRCQKRA